MPSEQNYFQILRLEGNYALKNKALTLNVWFQRSISNERDHKIKVTTSDKLQASVVQVR